MKLKSSERNEAERVARRPESLLPLGAQTGLKSETRLPASQMANLYLLKLNAT